MKEVLAQIFEHSFNEIYVFDDSSLHFLNVSKASLINLGYSEEEMRRMTPLQIKLDMGKRDFLALLDSLRQGEQKQVVFGTNHYRKNGTTYPVEVRLTYIRMDSQAVFMATIFDLSERKQASHEQKAKSARHLRQNDAYSHLTKQDLIGRGRDAVLHEITKSVATALEVHRVRIWVFEENLSKAECVSLYQRDTNSHRSGAEISLAQFPRYFHAITESRALSATPAAGDPRFSEICGTDLCPDPLTSLLITPIRMAHRLAGVMSCEMVGTDRAWCPDEENFAASMADFVALALSEAELVRAKEMAEQAERAKSTFLSNMSHELRTPLNAVLGFAQLLKADPTVNIGPEHREYVENILKGGWHLLDMVNDLLDLSFVESGRLQLNLSGVKISPVLDECLDMLSAQILSQGITLESSVKGCSEWTVWADPVRLKQALLNLLSNAVKFNQYGGRLGITCAPLPDGTIRTLIRDYGKGISPENMNQLFEPFNRLDEAKRQAIPGVGKGLVLTKKLVEMMGGNIGVISEVGSGSAFWIDLKPFLGEVSEKPGADGSHEAVGDKAFSRKEIILYVEDNPVNVRVVTQALKRFRPETLVLAAPTAKEGIELARAYSPDAILLDIGLPDMSGYEVLTALRGSALTRDTPIVGISSNATPEDVEKGLQAGFQGYLTKPLMFEEFNNMMNHALPRA